jgi:hypothetical protein
MHIDMPIHMDMAAQGALARKAVWSEFIVQT